LNRPSNSCDTRDMPKRVRRESGKPRKPPRRDGNQRAFDVIQHVIRLGDQIDKAKPKH